MLLNISLPLEGDNLLNNRLNLFKRLAIEADLLITIVCFDSPTAIGLALGTDDCLLEVTGLDLMILYFILLYTSYSLRIGKVSTAVEIISINKQAGADNVFIARWREKTFDNQTKKETVKVYSGTFSIIVDSKGQTTEEEVLHNPLGIFINDFSISEEQ